MFEDVSVEPLVEPMITALCFILILYTGVLDTSFSVYSHRWHLILLK